MITKLTTLIVAFFFAALLMLPSATAHYLPDPQQPQDTYDYCWSQNGGSYSDTTQCTAAYYISYPAHYIIHICKHEFEDDDCEQS